METIKIKYGGIELESEEIPMTDYNCIKINVYDEDGSEGRFAYVTAKDLVDYAANVQDQIDKPRIARLDFSFSGHEYVPYHMMGINRPICYLKYIDKDNFDELNKEDFEQLPIWSLEDHINYSKNNYPSLYGDDELTRINILDQIFFTNGNGLYWCEKTGTIFAEENVDPNIKIENWDEEIAKNSDRLEQMVKWFKALGKNTDELTVPYFYPLCEYALINTYPDNVQPDYVKGMVELCETAIKYDEKHFTIYTSCGQTYESVIQEIKDIQSKIMKQFPDLF